jgi:hypothetical protein
MAEHRWRTGEWNEFGRRYKGGKGRDHERSDKYCSHKDRARISPVTAKGQKCSEGVCRQELFILGFKTRRDILMMPLEMMRVLARALTIYRNWLELSSIKSTWV